MSSNVNEKILDVYLHDIYAGELKQDLSGKLCFTYDPLYVEQKQPALSLSLPLRSDTFSAKTVKAFFSGLLPESLALRRLARYLGVSENNPFAILKKIGVECAGAISLYPHGKKSLEAEKDDIEILDEHRLAEILDLLKSHPLLTGSDGIRLSLAGAQDKMAVGLIDGKIALMKGELPTTHILKPLISHVEDSVHNEFFCMRLAELIGIEVPAVDIHFVNNTPFYLIERYDRMKNKIGEIYRLHQEDFCQALAIPPEFKYENEGGPGILTSQTLLKDHVTYPAVDQLKFLKRIIFNYLIGNSDAHAKNFSLLYKNGKPELAPAYDLLSTAVYSNISIKMAMKIGGRYKPDDVCLRHWHRIVPDTITAKNNIEKQLKEMSEKCLEYAYSLKENLRKDNMQSPIFNQICSTIKQRGERILNETR